jgi:hypothetical protein
MKDLYLGGVKGMSHNVRPQSPIFGGAALAEKGKQLQRQLLIERQKLENLIIMQYEKGAFNLGSDIGILTQSSVMDKLLLDIMLMENQEKKC